MTFDNLFRKVVFTKFTLLKSLSSVAFEIGAQKQTSTTKSAAFNDVLSSWRLSILLQNSIGLILRMSK